MPQDTDTARPGRAAGRQQRLADIDALGEALGDTLGDRASWPVARIMNRDVLHCPPDTALDEAASMMTLRRCSSILVIDDAGKILGIWTERDALAVDVDDLQHMTVPIRDVMSSPVRTVSAETTLETLIGSFRAGSVRHYVVVEDEQPVGVVSQSDIVRHQGINSFLTLRHIGSLVREAPLLVDGNDTVSAIAGALRRHQRDAAVVTVEGKPYGMLTERDVLRLIAHRMTAKGGREVCSHPLVSAPPDMPLIQAHDLMERRHIRHLTVIDPAGDPTAGQAAETVVALLSFRDILGAIELDYSRYLHAALARQDAAIRAKEERQRQIIAATQEGYVELDAAGCIVGVNAAMERLVGRNAAELIGLTPPDLVAPAFLDLQTLQMERIGETEHRNYELDMVHADGRSVPVRVSATTLHDEDGAVSGAFAFLTDLSDLREAERQLTRLVDKVSRSNAELESFAYVISHDLQEPLRMIASYLRLVERRYGESLDPEGVEFIDYAVDGAKRMQSMITDLLDYSRIDRRGRTFAPCDMGGCLGAGLRHLEQALEEVGGVVDFDALPSVKGDEAQLARLFQNLIGNAIKYAHPDRPPRIQVGARRGDAGDDWLFWVRDNGIGIDPAFSTRVFRMFQRLHTRAQYTGNGIGLAVCKRIVERHGGTIWMEGVPDAGATVWFTLPDDPATRGITP